jgi:uncharacterized membrane protein
MLTALKAYGFTAAIFLVVDLIWLMWAAKGFYRGQLGALLRPDFVAPAGIAFYLLYVGGIVWFAVLPALAGGDWRQAALNGALLGLIAYATYNLTNLTTLAGWPVPLTFVDIAWGSAVTAIAATGGYLLSRAV